MARRRKAISVTLTDSQRERLERLWFYYGNYGPETTPGNHQFIQGLLEHGLDLRPLQTKRTARRDIPTAECVAAVEAVLTPADSGEESSTPRALLRLVPSSAGERKPVTTGPELKKMLDEMRRRLSTGRDRSGRNGGGEDAA